LLPEQQHIICMSYLVFGLHYNLGFKTCKALQSQGFFVSIFFYIKAIFSLI